MTKQERLEQFGRLVRYYRGISGMTLQELADKSGYTSRSTVAKLEKGKIDVPTSKVQAIADALGVTPLDIMPYMAGADTRNYDEISERLDHLSEHDRQIALKLIDGVLKTFEE